MDLSSIIFIIGAVLLVVFIIGIINRLMHMVISAVVFVGVLALVWYVTPIEYKACVDLSLALSGSRLFQEVSEEHQEIIGKTKVLVNYESKLTIAYPEFDRVTSNKTPITNENNHDFNMDLFTYDKTLQAIKIRTTQDKRTEVNDTLRSIGVKVN